MIEFHELRDLPVFEGVDDGTLARVAALAADVRVDEDQWLIREGDPAVFFVLLSGSYELVKRYSDGERTLARSHRAGRVLRRAADRARHDLLRGRDREDAGPRRSARACAVRHARRSRRRSSATASWRRWRCASRASSCRRQASCTCRSWSAARTTRLPRHARLPLAQPGALRVGRSGGLVGRGPARPRAGAAGGRRLLGADAARRQGALAPDAVRARRRGRPAGRARARDLRRRRDRRRPDRSRRGGVRRLRGPAHAARRARGDGWPGGHLVAHRELPRLPERRLGRRPGGQGARAGAAARGRDRRDPRDPHDHARTTTATR